MRRKKSDLCGLYDISCRTVDRKIHWIRQHHDRYPVDAVVRAGRYIFIREDVFEDAWLNSDRINAGLKPEFEEGRMHQK